MDIYIAIFYGKLIDTSISLDWFGVFDVDFGVKSAKKSLPSSEGSFNVSTLHLHNCHKSMGIVHLGHQTQDEYIQRIWNTLWYVFNYTTRSINSHLDTNNIIWLDIKRTKNINLKIT